MTDNIKATVLEALHKADLVIRPYAIFCNPFIEDYLRQEFGKQYEVVGYAGIEENKVYVVDRKAFEEACKVIPTGLSFD